MKINAIITFKIKGVEFQTPEEFIAITKNNKNLTLDDYKLFFHSFLQERDEPYRSSIPFWTEEHLKFMIESTPTLNIKGGIEKYKSNASQLATFLSFFELEEIINHVNAKVISEETITKTQERTFILKPFNKNDLNGVLSNDMFEKRIISYEDTYVLLRVPKEEFGLDKDVFIITFDCTSTGKKYFLFVDKQYATSAIDAIASTLRDENGNRLTREQYLKIEKES